MTPRQANNIQREQFLKILKDNTTYTELESSIIYQYIKHFFDLSDLSDLDFCQLVHENASEALKYYEMVY